MTLTARRCAVATASWAVLAAAGGAAAQTSPGASPPPPADATGGAAPTSEVQGGGAALSEVVVTAQRRSQNLQNVPIAVTAFTAETLAAQQVTSTLDLGRQVPNMSASNNVGQASANVYYIRALGQTQSFATFEPQVGTYVDDIYVARQNANNFALFGVDSIQVLNGPQGTLFGRNSTGGAILVTLKKPERTFGGDVQLGYGSFNGFTGRASVDMPINDQVLTRTSVFGITNDGYVRDVTTGETLNSVHNFGVREAVRLLPASHPNVEWNLAVDYSRNDSANLLNQPSDLGGVHGSNRVSYSGFSEDGGALRPYLAGAKGDFGQGALVQSYGFSSAFKSKFDAGTLDLITGYRGLSQHLGADFPATSLGPLDVADVFPTGEITLAQSLRSYQVSQEVKWTGDLGPSFTYTTGVFALYESNRTSYGQVLGLGPALALTINDQFFKNDTVSAAVYAQGDYKLTDALTVTLGGRFTHEVKTVRTQANQPGLGYSTADVRAAGYDTRLTADEFTPRLALQYQVDPNLMVFASATRGFQGGGWNGVTGPVAADFNNFGPETIWSYETGFRSQTADRRLRFNATAFYENVNGYQLLSDNPLTGSFDTANAADLAAYGLEVNVTWRPIDNLTLGLNASGIKATFFNQISAVSAQQTACVAGVVSRCGSGIVRPNGDLATPVYAPPYNITASGSYIFDFPRFTLTPNIALQFVGREWFDNPNTFGYASGFPGVQGGLNHPRQLLDISFQFALKNRPITITAECKNCTMQDYGVANLLGYDYFNYPGTWNVSVAYRF